MAQDVKPYYSEDDEKSFHIMPNCPIGSKIKLPKFDNIGNRSFFPECSNLVSDLLNANKHIEKPEYPKDDSIFTKEDDIIGFNNHNSIEPPTKEPKQPRVRITEFKTHKKD